MRSTRARLLLDACEAGIKEMLKTSEGERLFPNNKVEYQDVAFSVAVYFDDEKGAMSGYVFELCDTFVDEEA